MNTHNQLQKRLRTLKSDLNKQTPDKTLAIYGIGQHTRNNIDTLDDFLKDTNISFMGFFDEYDNEDHLWHFQTDTLEKLFSRFSTDLRTLKSHYRLDNGKGQKVEVTTVAGHL